MIRREINVLNNILSDFKRGQKKMDPELAYQLTKIHNLIIDESIITVTKEHEIIEKYGSRGEDNLLKVNENGDYIFSTENAQLANEDFKALYNEIVNITLPKIHIADFRPLKLDMNEIEALMPILEE